MPVRTDAGAALAGRCDDVREATADDAVDGVVPAYVVRPSSTEETAQAMGAAAALDLAVVARGAGTKLTWGSPPRRLDAVLDLSRLNAVVDHTAGDLVAVAQAGCPIRILQEALAPAGQRLAIDEARPGATLGGAIATNSSGPRRMLNGTFRDLMIGTTVVRADGAVAKSGGRVVKNVAGYDLGKLMTGSFGTLAVVTEAVFRLHPLPAASCFLTAPARDAERVARLVSAVVHSDLVPTAVEVEWTAGRGSVALLLEGSEDGVRTRAALARDLLVRAGAADVEAAPEPPDWWGRHPWAAGGLALKLTCALSGLRRLLSGARAHGVDVRGSAGSGVLYGTGPVGQVSALVPALRKLCLGLGGSLVVLDAPPRVKAELDLWGPVPALGLMLAVKDQFDPRHRLAPGRFVGGI